MESVFNLIPSVVQSKAAKVALAAFVIDTLVALVSLTIMYGTGFFKLSDPTALNPNDPIAPIRYIVLVFYLLLFFIIWFILYIQDRAGNDDGFSIIRKKLTGMWIVSYGTPYGHNFDRRIATKNAIGCSIVINQDNRKLELKFRIRENRIFTDDDAQVIKIICLRRDHESNYYLFYYFKGFRKLQKEMSAYIEPEASHSADTVEVEFLGKLTFEASDNNVKVTSMNGEWFDLNGNISKLLSLLDSADDVSRIGNDVVRKPERKPLSDIRILDYSAFMGEVSFSRDVS